ncbi:hypothetical protein [Paenibacillus illinoisensis]|uniref:hypothetical protein n=1 Tax=Paenibacillus illinoisensis TaxID=59845 RepID=UPI00301D6716
MKQIKVRCIESFQVFNHDGTQLFCEVNEGEVLTAQLHEESEEYCTLDARDLCVGHLDFYGKLILDDCFELAPKEGADTE